MPRAGLTPEAVVDAALAAPATVLLDVFRAVMRGCGLPERLDESYDHLIQMFIGSRPGHRCCCRTHASVRHVQR